VAVRRIAGEIVGGSSVGEDPVIDLTVYQPFIDGKDGAW
jgi:hypothetical protein